MCVSVCSGSRDSGGAASKMMGLLFGKALRPPSTGAAGITGIALSEAATAPAVVAT